MLNLIMLVVFSAVTLFFVYYIAINAGYAKRSANLDDTHSLIRAVGGIILSVVVIAALWIEAGFVHFFA
ncbi:hypothetical protein SAMN02910384_01507 [Pseudobutyrivibrio sp. ACV-2]|uniref:hypothetical protein n=1 Tax=Pseudobutyrivibrio sp. ACV-2 TaxID=1520801 RepID=UPI00089891AF|nr:hypothetical protein [Pseudobutyrivibrio sp. ACV-2]SEA42457.1 hypothetical protein SAMN02910384_01507 [Pseudobutyrivibrio sp. ACV-2]